MEVDCKQTNKENQKPTRTKGKKVGKIDKLLCKVEELVESLNYEDASNVCDKILRIDSNNCDALELKSSIAVEMSQYDIAIECLDKAISVQPFSGFNKYLSRAQLSTGLESLHFYNKGIELIKVEITKNAPASHSNESMDVDEDPTASVPSDGNDTLKSLNHELSTVYCNIAELYMTDLCDEDDAEDHCKAAIKKAIETEPLNPEPYVMKARFEIILGDTDAALSSILKSTVLWFPKIETDSPESLLCASARHNTAKVLIELKQHTEAQVVLETLLQENDQVVEFWYLMGWNNYLQGENGKELSKESFIKAKKVDRACPCDDEDMLHHIDELLQTLGVDPSSINYEEDSDDDVVDDDDDEYEDIDELEDNS